MASGPSNLYPMQSNGQALKGRIGPGVRRAFSLLYRNPVDPDMLFVDCISGYLRSDSVVLDAGCGGGSFLHYGWKKGVRLLAGCDISDPASIRQNENISAGARADLAHLPFRSGSFDAVFSRYVLEHLEGPERAFTELARVLRPGGHFILLTPSKYHYVSLFSRLTPHSIHGKVSSLRGNSVEDACPTRYLANSKTELSRLAAGAGLRLKEFRAIEVCPNYLLWSLPTFLLGVGYERLVNRFECLSPLRVNIIAVFER